MSARTVAVGGRAMEKLVRVEGRAYPFGRANVDTDTILPSRWLKTIGRTGLGRGAFEPVRRDPDNVFDDPRFRDAPILLAGANFGCGSSREHAVWAMREMGIRVVIAPGFSDIFAGNAYRNGILTAVLPQADLDRLCRSAASATVTVDLRDRTVTTTSGDRLDFAVDSFRRDFLLRGLDEIAVTLEHQDAIAAFERDMAAERRWIGATSASAPPRPPGPYPRIAYTSAG